MDCLNKQTSWESPVLLACGSQVQVLLLLQLVL